MPPAGFGAAFADSPMRRAKLSGLGRNIALVLGNVGAAGDVDVLTRGLADPNRSCARTPRGHWRGAALAPSSRRSPPRRGVTPTGRGWCTAVRSGVYIRNPAPMPRSPTRRPPPVPARGRKNMRLDQALLDSAKRALGVESETEAVTLALWRVVDNARVADGIRVLSGRLMFDESRIND